MLPQLSIATQILGNKETNCNLNTVTKGNDCCESPHLKQSLMGDEKVLNQAFPTSPMYFPG